MRWLIAAFLLIVGGHAGAVEERTVYHDGQDRTYLIEHPAEPGPSPALVVLHGGGGNAEQIRAHAGFSLTQHGWIEIYPNALGKQWNDGRTALSAKPLRKTDDVGFLRAVLSGLVREGLVDPDRIFFAGPSNGGAMTQRMACEAPDLVTGAVSVIMNFPVGLDCPPAHPIPMMFILGTDDPIVPFNGGPITLGQRDRGGVMPAPDTLAFYAGRNQCKGADTRRLPNRAEDDGTRVTAIRYSGCSAPTEALVIEGGGHTWPGARDRAFLRRIVGRTSRDISATEEIETFLLRLVRD